MVPDVNTLDGPCSEVPERTFTDELHCQLSWTGPENNFRISKLNSWLRFSNKRLGRQKQ